MIRVVAGVRVGMHVGVCACSCCWTMLEYDTLGVVMCCYDSSAHGMIRVVLMDNDVFGYGMPFVDDA